MARFISSTVNAAAHVGAPSAAGQLSVRPVAVLFGWVGAQDKHLKKYADLYHDLGIPTVLRATVPTSVVFSMQSQQEIRKIAEELLHRLNVSWATGIVRSCMP